MYAVLVMAEGVLGHRQILSMMAAKSVAFVVEKDTLRLNQMKRQG